MPGDLLKRALAAVIVCALALPAAALAHTDGTKQLELTWPAQGTVTSPFGRDGSRWHPGLDIGSLRSLAVTAAAPGVVTAVGEPAGFEGYGAIVGVSVGQGYETLYAHLAAAAVRVGQKVEQGDPLGTAGCTGWCTGTHLHFELRLHGVAVDPTLLLG